MKRPTLTYAPKDLQLSDEEFHALHQKADGRAKRITVEGEALRHLLHDHSALYRCVEEVDQHLRHPEAAKPLSDDPLVVESRKGLHKGRLPRSQSITPATRRRKRPDEEDLIG